MNLATESAARRCSPGVARTPKTALMLLMRIERWDVRRDGPLSQAALEQKVRALGYQAVLRAYPAGAIAAAQTDTRERIEAVISGLIKVTIDGEAAILSEGDFVIVPRGGSRRLEVVGASPASCLEGMLRGERS